MATQGEVRDYVKLRDYAAGLRDRVAELEEQLREAPKSRIVEATAEENRKLRKMNDILLRRNQILRNRFEESKQQVRDLGAYPVH